GRRGRRDQDHRGSAVIVLGDEPPRQLEAALLAERDVDEHDVGPERLSLPKRFRARRGDAGDRQALLLEQRTGGSEGRFVVVDDATDEELAIHTWRAEQLHRLGFSRALAERFAALVDWHEIAALVARGCPPELALEIAR